MWKSYCQRRNENVLSRSGVKYHKAIFWICSQPSLDACIIIVSHGRISSRILSCGSHLPIFSHADPVVGIHPARSLDAESAFSPTLLAIISVTYGIRPWDPFTLAKTNTHRNSRNGSRGCLCSLRYRRVHDLLHEWNIRCGGSSFLHRHDRHLCSQDGLAKIPIPTNRNAMRSAKRS